MDATGYDLYKYDFIFWLVASSSGMIAAIFLSIIDRFEGTIYNAKCPALRQRERIVYE